MKKIELANKELEAFLRKEKVFTKFIKNATAKKLRGLGRVRLMESYTLKISESFNWDRSLEGVFFWRELHENFTLKNYHK